MKNIFLSSALFLSVIFSTKAQVTSCENFCVGGITIDTTIATNHKLNVTVYNGNDTSTYIDFPIVRVTDNVGDTVGNKQGLYYTFFQRGGDTVVYAISTPLSILPVGFTGTVYLTDGLTDSTCSFNYPMTCTVGIHEQQASRSLNIFPNPATDEINLFFGDASSNPVLIHLYDMTGNLVRTFQTTNNQLTINRNGLTNGIYFVTLDDRQTRLTRKLVLQ